ncbi:MAG: hypothetical protein BA864_15255 [Desulfuromonadales bacterium C00003093]|nr:MAG: hypothetical protein BA864_15255 [Desulfuromonadales bacterium C00003093]
MSGPLQRVRSFFIAPPAMIKSVYRSFPDGFLLSCETRFLPLAFRMDPIFTDLDMAENIR